MADSLPASSSTFTEVADAPGAASCWKCRGLPLATACKVCHGTGKVPRAKPKSKPARAVKLFPDFIAPGPLPLAPDLPELRLRDDEDLCYLIGQWRIFQFKALHRYSTDDVVTAWAAYRMRDLLTAAKRQAHAAATGVETLRTLDIGCGIGSVALMTAWLFPEAQCFGVEAQATRYAQALRSAAYNGVGSRLTLSQGDLRDPSIYPPASFDLVTGTPPYFDVNVGGTPDCAESARCLFEFRGGIEVYCAAAARLLAPPHGLFVVVETAQAVTRSYAAATAAGLRVLARIDIIPREGKPVLINVFVMGLEGAEAFYGGAGHGGESAAPFLAPSTFEPHGRSPYDPPAAAAAAAAEKPRDDDAAPPGASSAGAFVERLPGPTEHAAVAREPATESSPSTPVPEGLEEPVAAGAKRRRAPVQPIKPMPDARPGELVVRIPVRDVSGARTQSYRKLLLELGKPA